MSSKIIGIEEARRTLGDLVTAAQQGAAIILTRNGRPAARIIRYQEKTMKFHGYVIKRTDGVLARCGGPALCADCRFEQEMVALHRPSCLMLQEPPPGFPPIVLPDGVEAVTDLDGFSCDCNYDGTASPDLT